MKVRDLRQYIKAISKGNETLELVGSNREYFLNMMSGQGQKVDALITGAASFANNAKEQLFYEFVQNAYDANADTLLFYANEDFLIVLNNGEPFFTDLDIFDLPEGEEPRDGQLYNFLAKGKSLKLNDDDKLGKYGQGSKLLYTLLADINHNVNTEELLKDAIINNKKGPYLVSWHNMSQLDAWLINDDEWIPAQADDVENNILFAKILMSYYPIAPGQDFDKFTNEEAQRAIQAFNELVDPPRNKSFLTRGTALIIPLGKGKYEAIIEENNIANVRARLGGFASITADQERNEGKSLKHIYVMGKEVEQHSVRSLFIDFEESGNKFHYHFAFNPIFAEKNVVNFFKGLPILQTKYRFGFILDSQILEVDDSRQRISDTEKTCDQLRLAYTHLVEELKSLIETNREKFDYIYQSLISSRPEDNSEDEQKIRKAFYDVIRPFLNEYAYTSEGTYVPFEEVCEEEKEANVLLKDIGIDNLHWIDADGRKKYAFHFDKKIRVLGFAEMLQMAADEKLSAWIKGMSKEDYKFFHNNCLDCISEIKDIKVFRSNENNLYSWEELNSDINVYYMAQDTEPIFVGQEYIVETMCDEYDSDDYSTLFDKIKANLAELRETSMGRDAVCQTLCMIAENESDYEDEIKNDVAVLQNWRGDYLPFSELFEERLEGTILFDNFRIKGSIPECVKQQDWLIDKQGDDTALWKWIVNHFNDIKREDGWGDDTDAYLRDIQNAYKTGGVSDSLPGLYLDEDGKPTDEPCQNVENFEKLSEAEYEKLQVSYSDYNFVPYKYEKVLSSAPFKMKTLYVNDLVNPNQYIDFDTLAILSKMSSDGFLLKYRVIGDENSFRVQSLNGGKNYTNDLSTDLRRALLEIGFYYIPQKVQTLILSETNAFNITRDDFAKSVVDKISDKNLIFPLIRNCSSAVVEHYINSLSTISIDHKISESDMRWQIIKFAVSRDNEENEFKQTIFDCIRHKNEVLPETIKDSVFIAYGHEYNLYSLNTDYQEENEHIDSFLDCLPSANDAEWFKEQFYGDKKEIVSCKEIYDEIKDKYLSIEQLRFCLDYSLNDEPDYYNLEIDKEESLSEALTMIKANQYRGFDEYFKISDFDSETQVFAEQSLLNDEEKLPNEMQKWLEQNVDAIGLFENIRTESESYISVRRHIRDNVEAIAVPDFEDSDKTDSTLSWLLNAKLIFVYGDNAYKNIKRIIDRLPEGIDNMVFLRYTGNVECRDKSLDSICPTFTLEEYDKESCFLSIFAWTPIFLDMLKNDKKVQNFFINEIVFAYEGLELLSKHKLHKAPKLEVSVKAHEGDYKEITSEPYMIWKKMPESRGILIKTSKKPIGINFTMLKNREQVFSKAIDNKEFGYDTNALVVVQYPNPEKLSAIKMIEKHIADMEFFQQPFIVLQGLYVDQLEKLEQLAEEKGTDIATIVQTSDTSRNSGNNAGNDANLKVDEDKLETVKELVDSFDADELMELADKKDKILEVLHEMEDAEDETQESQVRQTIGYIGELIYEQYLLKQGKEYKYAAIEGVGDYDFHNITDRIYIDVKTTLYSLKEGTAPFYLHKSQNMFMQKHPNEKYHIVRISLNDLDLQKSYERIRDIYGKEANPMVDDRLKEDCMKIAKKYWRGAKIEQFDALSPEYSIKIEKK